jgi:hypothetical protein
MLDLNSLTKLASEAEIITTNPMAQQVLYNPIIAGVVDQVEKLTGRDLKGNGTTGPNLEAINEDDEIDDEDEDDTPDDIDTDKEDLIEKTDEEHYIDSSEDPDEDEVITVDDIDNDSEPMIDA